MSSRLVALATELSSGASPDQWSLGWRWSDSTLQEMDRVATTPLPYDEAAEIMAAVEREIAARQGAVATAEAAARPPDSTPSRAAPAVGLSAARTRHGVEAEAEGREAAATRHAQFAAHAGGRSRQASRSPSRCINIVTRRVKVAISSS